jgi:hypothetical protein
MIQIAVWISLLLQAVQPATPGSIEGTVVRAGSGEPIVGAQVTIAAAGTTPRVTLPAALTDRTGKFTFPQLQPGSYTITAASNGYAKQAYGQRQADSSAIPIPLTSAQTKNISIALTPAGSVAGRVRNSNGRPAPGVVVRLVRRRYNSNGQASFDSVASDRSDDRGAYRFYWVSPGRYHVMAGAPGGFSARVEASDNSNEVAGNYAYTFFPGHTDFEKAVPITVRSGVETDGLDFALTDTRQFRISGRVIDPRTGQPPTNISGVIYQRDITGAGSSLVYGNSGYNSQSGSVSYGPMPPGRYSIRVAVSQDPGNPNAPINPEVAVTAVVTDANVDLGVLRLELPSAITGRITSDAPLPADRRGGVSTAAVSLLSPESLNSEDPRHSVNIRPQQDGTFTANFTPSLLRVADSVPGFFVREARLDGADALGDFARISRASNLQIELSSRVAQLEGMVRDEKAQPAAGVRVVLVPDAKRDHPELFKEALSDQTGRFSITSIRPGSYKVFASDAIERYAYFDPAVLRLYEQRAQSVSLAESARSTMELKMLPSGVE